MRYFLLVVNVGFTFNILFLVSMGLLLIRGILVSDEMQLVLIVEWVY